MHSNENIERHGDIHNTGGPIQGNVYLISSGISLVFLKEERWNSKKSSGHIVSYTFIIVGFESAIGQKAEDISVSERTRSHEDSPHFRGLPQKVRE